MKVDYGAMFTKRKNGLFQKRMPDGKYLYDRDPKVLYQKVMEYTPNKVPTFKAVADAWAAQKEKEITFNTWKAYKFHYKELVDSIGSKLITEIMPSDAFNEYLKLKEKGQSRSCAEIRRSVLNGIMYSAVVQDLITVNPCADVKIPSGMSKEKRHAPTDIQIKTIFNSIDKEFGFYAFFLLCTGMRRNEALALTCDDINLDSREISVSKTLVFTTSHESIITQPKTLGSVREIPILDVLYEPLKSRMNGGILFESRKGGYMSRADFIRCWRLYQEQTGLDIIPHQLRHGTATLMFESGVDVFTCQSVLGHSSVSTTMEIYTELRNAQRKKSLDKMDEHLSSIVQNVN